MLLRWRDTTSSTALYRDLYRALCHNRVGLNNVAKEFCGKEISKCIFLSLILKQTGKMKKLTEYKLWFSPVCDAKRYFLPICYGFN